LSFESFTSEAVTRLYLIKQSLFAKAKRRDLLNVVDRVCGLQAQAATTPYLSLWSRVEDFTDDLLNEALFTTKSLAKTWVMRGTLHVIPSEDLPIYNHALRTMWFEHHGRFMRAPDWPTIKERRQVIYPKIMEALSEAPLRRKELGNKVRSLLNDGSRPYERLFSGWGGILKETAYQGLTVHAQPCERESCFARLDQWLPSVNLDEVTAEEAQEKLLIKYLHGYGPASQQDFSLWSGLIAADSKRAITNSERALAQIKVEGVNRPLLILREDLKTLRSIDLDEHAPACLLPKFDSMLLGHKNRSRIIRDELKGFVFRSAVGDIAATVLVKGRAVGTWRHKKTKHTLVVTVKPFEKIAKADLKEVEQKAKELSQYLGAEELKFSLSQ
jgi:uncharacterized protein YcaQ